MKDTKYLLNKNIWGQKIIFDYFDIVKRLMMSIHFPQQRLGFLGSV